MGARMTYLRFVLWLLFSLGFSVWQIGMLEPQEMEVLKVALMWTGIFYACDILERIEEKGES